MSEGELDDLMGEVGGPCNVTGMINMLQEKMAGDGNDPDELILQAFMPYDLGGKIDVKMFQHSLRTLGDKMSNAEIDDIFEQFDVDEDYMVKTKEVVGLFVAVKEEEKKEEKKEEVVEAAPEEEGDDAKKKKKRVMMPRRRRRRRRRLPSKCTSPNVMIIRLILVQLIFLEKVNIYVFYIGQPVLLQK